MSSLSAASALPASDGAPPTRQAPSSTLLAESGSRSRALGRRGERILLAALIASLVIHLLGVTGAADWITAMFNYQEPDPGPPLRAVLKPPPPPVYQAQPAAPPPKPKPRPKPRPAPMFTAPTAAIEPEVMAPPAEPAIAAPAPMPVAEPPVAVAEAAPVVAEPVAATEPAAIEPAKPAPRVPKRIDLVGTLFAGEQNFMVGTGGFRLRHDGNRYEISVLGQPTGLAKLLLSGEFSGVSRGAITPSGLQPSEYMEERGARDKRETATLDWEAGVIRLRGDKVVAIEPPTFDRLSVLLQFYYRPPDAAEMTVRVAGTRNVDTYTFRKLRNEPVEMTSGTIDAQLWRVNHDNGEPRIDLWMSPEYHYLPLRVRVYSRKEFGGRFATLNIDEIRVED